MKAQIATKPAVVDAPGGRVFVTVIATSYDVWKARTPHPAVVRMEEILVRPDPYLIDHQSSTREA